MPSVHEADLYAARTAVTGRPLKFVYFGGGTPSYISARHLQALVGRLRDAFPWDDVEEVTFEGEPGTLTERKIEAIRKVGITRLSLGVENFNDRILEENGRAHLSRRDLPMYPLDRGAGFRPAQHRSDLRHGRRDLGDLARLGQADGRP